MHSVMECLFFLYTPCQGWQFQTNFAVVIGLSGCKSKLQVIGYKYFIWLLTFLIEIRTKRKCPLWTIWRPSAGISSAAHLPSS